MSEAVVSEDPKPMHRWRGDNLGHNCAGCDQAMHEQWRERLRDWLAEHAEAGDKTAAMLLPGVEAELADRDAAGVEASSLRDELATAIHTARFAWSREVTWAGGSDTDFDFHLADAALDAIRTHRAKEPTMPRPEQGQPCCPYCGHSSASPDGCPNCPNPGLCDGMDGDEPCGHLAGHDGDCEWKP